MTDLREQLVRLAERGPFADPRRVVRQAMQRVSADVDEAQVEAGWTDPSEVALDEVASASRPIVLLERPVVGHPTRSHKLVLAAAAALVLVSVAGATMARSGFQSPSATETPSSESIAPSTTSDSAPSTSVSPDLHNDATLHAMLNTLLDVGTPDEMVLAFSTNVPESDVAACMSAAGYPYVQGPTSAQQVADDPHNTMSAADFAVTYGFGLAAADLGLLPQSVDPNLGYRSSLTSAELRTYVAINASCSGRTAERTRVSSALNVALAQVRQELSSDEQVVSALANWRACMSGAGFNYESPLVMLESFYARLNSGLDHEQLQQLLTDEIPVAIVNVPCQAAYTAAYREAAAARFGEFRSLFESTLGE